MINMLEEKELTVEEMKTLASVATWLPTLLERINSINKQVEGLKTAFAELANKYNDNTKAFIAYKNDVDDLIKNQISTKELQEELNTLKNSLVRIEASLSLTASEKPIKKESPKAVKKEEKKDDEDKDEVQDIVQKILDSHRGRKTRLLTLINVKQGFKCNDEVAQKVLDWLEKNKMYNPKTKTLTFPKR